eukprot:CAMPEP_0113952300 /NCGR_PEP_ID=MMETSP1339-20121228/90330_1 /TAXON_ID=94617 /ORGANISM="Fibrocapsa japonica" /LENGTH=739 /DNA_ID=CAMNT_0000960877 /DNA_START=109 /DNA_END=2330 /DNA_ORIENTATION=+ /assembly_acc=CAM_ASM_000762
MADDEKIQAPPDWKGPSESRKLTDVFMAIVLLACWALMTYLGMDAMEKGDPLLLVAGVDYKGRICGYADSEKERPYLYYISTDGTGICVGECPDHTDVAQFICTDEADGPQECNIMYQSYPVMGRCVFSDREIWKKYSSSMRSSTRGTRGESGSGVTLQTATRDMWTAKYYILNLGLVLSIVLGFIYLWILRLPGLVSVIIWSSIIFVFLALAALTGGLWYQGMLWAKADDGIHDETEVLMMKICAGIAGVLAIVWMCLACCMRKNIILAGGVITEAARPVLLMPILFAWPILQLIGVLLFMWPWTYYVIYTASMGEWVNETDAFGITAPQFQYDESVQWRGWYLLFCLIWTVEWLVAIGQIVLALSVAMARVVPPVLLDLDCGVAGGYGQIVLALSVAQWYFSRDKASVHSGVAVRAIFQTFYYHTGTAAMGSLLLAILTLLRIMLTQIQKKAESSGNVVVKAFFCCCQCCLWCLDKCIRFINKNAYIQTAIFSYGFYTGCVKSFFLVLRNVGRVTAVTVVGEFVIKVMQLVIVGVSGAVAGHSSNGFSSPCYPDARAIILTQIQKKAESTGNTVVKAFFCCLQCCLWCLDKCIRFINKNAYIQTALFSYGFFTACVKSFQLILRNVGRVTAVTVVGEFVIKVMQLVIVGVSGAVAYFVMDSYLEEELNSLIVPTIFVMVLAWYISTKFAEIFGMAILTILQCFIADEEMFDPSQMYAHGELRDYIDTFGGERRALIN